MAWLVYCLIIPCIVLHIFLLRHNEKLKLRTMDNGLLMQFNATKQLANVLLFIYHHLKSFFEKKLSLKFLRGGRRFTERFTLKEQK